MNTSKKWMIGIALAGLLALGGTAVYAATPSQDTPATPTTVDEDTDTTLEWGRGDRLELHDDLLANSLGITVDELQTARRAAYKAALADAVEQGAITQAQADRFQDNPGMGLFLLKDTYDQADADAFIAQALGISVEELQSARDNAITKGVEAGLLTEEEGITLQVRKLVAEAVTGARTQALQDAVAQGLLTQEQADAMIAHPLAGWGMGRHMGRGMMNGGMMNGGMMDGDMMEGGRGLFGLGMRLGMGNWLGGEGMHGGMMGRGDMMGRGGADDSND